MKNKVFNIVLAIIVIKSLTSMKTLEVRDCVDGTFDAMDDMLDLGYSTETASCVGNYYYAECTGWEVTYENYLSCLE